MKTKLIAFLFLALGACSASKRQDSPAIGPNIARVAAILAPSLTGDASADADLVRRFVHDNSVHDMSYSPDERASDPERAAYDLLSYYDGVAAKPNLYCGHRARVMVAVLQALSREARITSVMDDQQTTLGGGHIHPEIFNPKTGHWEINDPDMDQYFVSSRESRRLGVLDMVFGDTHDVVICTPQRCAHDNVSPEGFDSTLFLENFYKATLIEDERIYYINQFKFNLANAILGFGGMSILQWCVSQGLGFSFSV